MMVIEIHVYKKSTGEYLYTDIGNPENVMADLPDDRDFTLTPPPDNTKVWRWVGRAWE